MTGLSLALLGWLLFNAAFVVMRLYVTRPRREAAQILSFAPRATQSLASRARSF
jgi:hypothetical protein